MSPALLQHQLIETAKRANMMQDMLFGVLKTVGRVRVPKADLEGLAQNMSIDARDIGDAWVFEIKESNMVVPQGVSGAEPPKESA